jgi:phospholipase A1
MRAGEGKVKTQLCLLAALLFVILATLAPTSAPALPTESAGPSAPVRSFQYVHTGPGLSLHREMYALPYTWSDRYHGAQTEAVFQLSAKHRLFGTRFYFAYTQISFWQAYDYRNSSPFRDTNYNPELFYRTKPMRFGGGRLAADAGFEHESNGQRVPLSRSWNLFYLAPYWERDDLLVYVKLRARVPEEDKKHPLDPEGDDNPDITDYLGYSDIHVFRRFAPGHLLHFTMRGVIGTGKGNVSLNYSYPVPHSQDSWFLLRVSHGYGESLMDYREEITRVGVGIMFAR